MTEKLYTQTELNELVRRRVAVAVERVKQKYQRGESHERRGDVKPMTFNEGDANGS